MRRDGEEQEGQLSGLTAKADTRRRSRDQTAHEAVISQTHPVPAVGRPTPSRGTERRPSARTAH
ncbi:hypothetical protein E2C01_053551 [Portunus trituberculatus]|uniref:Uncharacterized protein n=1 Tax=Portunus trituberculatus TaxID=210409 RepID=A0A5B7GR32_PORTR|nr:hypothetical protein [Portunus trituberculatus]